MKKLFAMILAVVLVLSAYGGLQRQLVRWSTAAVR